MFLTRFAINRWVITTMIFVALVGAGAFIFSFMLGRSSNPPGTTFPVVVVVAQYPGASPQDMEKLVIKPIEDQMDGVDHLDQMNATAQEGSAVVVVQFNIGTDLDLAAVDVQRRVDTARGYMPTDLNPPSVQKNGASEPLLDIAASSSVLSASQLADTVNNRIEPLLKAIPNVQTVDVYGTADREFHVQPNPTALVGAGATLEDIFNAVQNNNLNVPGGIMTQPTQEATVEVHSAIDKASDLLDVPLPLVGFSNLSGSVKGLTVGDVATAEDGHVEMRTISHYNGLPRVYISMGRDINADEIKSTAIVREQMKTIEAQFPQVQFSEIDAPADYTAESLFGVGQSLVEGIVLTALVMLLFLHAWRNAVVVFLAIPTSIFATFIVMQLLHFHIDSMSMMGLSLIIGILVDDSIVVLENITRHRDMGENPYDAAVNGRAEIGNAAVAITMVDVVVFLPIAFLPGIVGAYLKEFAAVVVIATLFSLLVSFTLTPLLAARWSVLQRSGAPPKWLTVLDTRRADVIIVLLGIALFALGLLFRNDILKVSGILMGALLILNWFVHRYDSILIAYKSHILPFALRHGSFVVFVCATLLINALALALVASSWQAFVAIDVFLVIGLFVTYGLGALSRRSLSARLYRTELAGGVAALGSTGSNPFTAIVRALQAFLSHFGTHRGLVFATLAIPVVLAPIMVGLGGINFDFVPAQQTGHINMTVTYPPGTPIAMTDGYVTKLESAILKLPGVKDVSSTVGRKPSGFGNTTGGNYAQLGADMQDDKRNKANDTILKIRDLSYLVPGGQLQVAGDSGGGSGQAISYSLTGPEDALDPAAEKVAAELRNTPGSVNVQSSAEVGAPRLNVNVDPAKCMLLGVSPSDVANVARIAVDGAVATKVRTATGLVDVRVQFPVSDRNEVEQLQNVRVRAADGTLLPLSSVATFQWATAPTKIERLNRERVINVLGDVLPGYSLGAVTGPLDAKLKEPGFLPSGVGLTAQGDTKFMVETMSNMGIALLVSGILIYMLMVMLYGSFVEPLIVMFSVPLAIIGALSFLALMGRLEPAQGQSLNIISMLGIVMLFGLVAKNGILLVDYSNTLVKRGVRVHDAVLQSAATRFRPIIMTTAAMIFGMLPLALGFSAGGEWRQAMGTVIIGGLISSLILTLVLVPMIYNTWMGAFERGANRKAAREESILEGLGGLAAEAIVGSVVG